MKKSLVSFWVLVLSLAASSMGSAAVKKEAATAQAPARFELNSATVDQLEQVPGIGRAMAERIIQYRAKNGNFTKLDELVNVRGIGEKSLSKLTPYLFVEAKSTRGAK